MTEKMKTLTFLSMLGFLLVFAFRSYSQLITVTGTVKNENSGETIRQLSIVEKMSGIGTITSLDGGFLLLLKSGKVELNFSDANYESLTVGFTLRNDTSIQVTVKPISAGADRKPSKNGVHLVVREKLIALKGQNK